MTGTTYNKKSHNSKPIGIHLENQKVVYKAINKINNKIYIGQTVGQFDNRRSVHLSKAKGGSNLYFHKALRKYGNKNFKWTILRYCENIESLNIWEEYYILYYNSTNREFGYNLTSGGLNTRHCQTTKDKIGNANRGANNSMFGLFGKDNPNYGSKRTKESLLKIRQCQKGKIINKETRLRMSLGQKGRKHSEETKEKLRLINTGRKVSKETRAKLSKRLKGNTNARKKKNGKIFI